MVRVHLAHAVVQAVADDCGADILHVKGPAIDPRISAQRRTSTDADVIVRPAHVMTYLATLQERGWELRTSFQTGSAFEHAASLWHQQLGWVDVHRQFPGIEVDPAEAFDILWRDSAPASIAHRACRVPGLDAQRLILLIHAARSHRPRDVEAAWSAERAGIKELARELRAEVALAAVTGNLDDFADRPTYLLWRHFSSGSGSRLDEWRARLKAAPSRRAALRLVFRALEVNTDHLAMRLGHQPSRAEVAQEYVKRARVAARESWTRVQGLTKRLTARGRTGAAAIVRRRR